MLEFNSHNPILCNQVEQHSTSARRKSRWKNKGVPTGLSRLPTKELIEMAAMSKKQTSIDSAFVQTIALELESRFLRRPKGSNLLRWTKTLTQENIKEPLVLKRLLKRINPADLCKLSTFCVRHERKNKVALQAVMEEVLQRRFKIFSPQHLASLSWCVAKGGKSLRQETVDQLFAAVITHLPSLKRSNADVLVIWSLLVAQRLDQTLFEDLIHLVDPKCLKNDSRAKRQLCQIRLQAKIDQWRWREEFDQDLNSFIATQPLPIPSRFQTKVVRTITRMLPKKRSVTLTEEALVDLYPVDSLIEGLQDQKNLIIQVNGPWHDPEDPAERLRDRQLRSLGCRLEKVWWTQWKQQQRISLLKSILLPQERWQRKQIKGAIAYKPSLRQSEILLSKRIFSQLALFLSKSDLAHYQYLSKGSLATWRWYLAEKDRSFERLSELIGPEAVRLIPSNTLITLNVRGHPLYIIPTSRLRQNNTVLKHLVYTKATSHEFAVITDDVVENEQAPTERDIIPGLRLQSPAAAAIFGNGNQITLLAIIATGLVSTSGVNRGSKQSINEIADWLTDLQRIPETAAVWSEIVDKAVNYKELWAAYEAALVNTNSSTSLRKQYLAVAEHLFGPNSCPIVQCQFLLLVRAVAKELWQLPQVRANLEMQNLATKMAHSPKSEEIRIQYNRYSFYCLSESSAKAAIAVLRQLPENKPVILLTDYLPHRIRDILSACL